MTAAAAADDTMVLSLLATLATRSTMLVADLGEDSVLLLLLFVPLPLRLLLADALVLLVACCCCCWDDGTMRSETSLLGGVSTRH